MIKRVDIPSRMIKQEVQRLVLLPSLSIDLGPDPDHQPECHRQCVIPRYHGDVEQVHEEVAIGEWDHALVKETNVLSL
jgi:hypothetical protein